MIQVVVFDLGKVLVDFDYGIAARKIAARGKITTDELARFIAHSPVFIQYETGLVTSEQFYSVICAATGFCGDFDEFGACFGDIFVAIEPMVQLHAALRRQGLATYIFSNTNDLAIRHIRRTFPFFSHFDGYILSYQHGVMKPDPRIYHIVENECGRRGADILYLDDRPENIAAGAALGWQVILQESPERTQAALRQLGLLNSSSSP